MSIHPNKTLGAMRITAELHFLPSISCSELDTNILITAGIAKACAVRHYR